MKAGQPAVRDAGLQPERTALAWTRTAFGLWLNAILTLRVGWVEESVGVVAMSCLLLIAAAGVLVAGRSRRIQLAAADDSIPPLRAHAALGIAATTFAAALTGVWSVAITT